MSDEESFVILGSSPMSSMDLDGNHEHKSSSSIETDTPGSSFGSLKRSQLKELQNAQEVSTQTPPQSIVENASKPIQVSQAEAQMSEENLNEGIKTTSFIKSIQNENNSDKPSFSNTQKQQQVAEPMSKSSTINAEGKLWSRPSVSQVEAQMSKENLNEGNKQIYFVKSIQNENNPDKPSVSNTQKQQQVAEPISKSATTNAESKLWSRPPHIERNVAEVLSCLSLEDCAVPSPLESKKQQQQTEDLNNKPQQPAMSTSNPTSLEKTPGKISNTKAASSPTANNSLASSFIMGEISADFLKTSVFSQFPSITKNSSAEDIVKLQNMVTENIQLKVILEKVNNTMRFFHQSSLQWQEKMNAMETKYKQELADCHKEIEMLRETNKDLQPQIEAVEIARKKDREETIQKLSEKSSLIDNMRAQIVKLEKQQMASFEFVDQISNKRSPDDFDKYYVPRGEHELKIKELERKLSELVASNLDLKDVEKQYIDEINCLKVTLTSAQELIKSHNGTIAQLVAKDDERLKKIKELQVTVAEQNERIVLLEHQNEVHRKDFEMEKESRTVALKEKQQMLQDLRNLQKRNQELIEEQQKIANKYEKHLNSLQSSVANPSYISAAAAAQTYINNPQRPIRNLPSTANPQQPAAPADIMQHCPICNKAFKSLSILQSHVNDCIDKN